MLAVKVNNFFDSVLIFQRPQVKRVFIDVAREVLFVSVMSYHYAGLSASYDAFVSGP